LTTYFSTPRGQEGKGANSTPMVIGTDKSDPKLKKYIQNIKSSSDLSGELFLFINLLPLT
jgi:hypothetical protein